MSTSNVDPDAKESTTKTMPFAKPSTPGPNVNSPSVHELAIQQVEEAFGPDAHNNPTFDARVKEVESQMRESIRNTEGL